MSGQLCHPFSHAWSSSIMLLPHSHKVAAATPGIISICKAEGRWRRDGYTTSISPLSLGKMGVFPESLHISVHVGLVGQNCQVTTPTFKEGWENIFR